MSSEAVDLGVLSDVIGEYLKDFEAVPVRALVRRYNERSKVPVKRIFCSTLGIACSIVPGAVVHVRKSGSVWGVVRSG